MCVPQRTKPISTTPPVGPSRPPSPELLLKALARLLRPLVRLLIRGGVTFPVLADLLRGLYVDVALRDLLADPKARTDSRVSLLTGVHRKEIRRQRTPETAGAEPAAVTRTSEIIARWLGAPAYTDPATRRPLPLPRAGADPSFEGLVASVTRDVRPRAVLDDLLDQGAVALEADGRVRLSAEAFIPRPGRDDQLFYFARNLHDHVAAASANVLAAGGGPAPFVDRSVHYDGLTAEAAARLEAHAREAAQRLLLDVNRLALELVEAQEPGEAQGAAPGSAPTRRVNLGVYLYAEDDPAADAGT